MKKYIKEFGAYFSILTGAITVNEYMSKRKNLETLVSEYNATVDGLCKKVEIKELERQIDLSHIKHQLMNFKTEVSTFIEKSTSASNEILNHGESETYQTIKEQAKTAFQKIVDREEEMEKLIDFLKDNKHNFKSEGLFEQYEHMLENFKIYLSTLSVEQTFALFHIMFFISMIFLIYNIAIIFYSDLIIKYFSIETKYPKFSRFIEIRRKFQRYYIT